PRSSLGLARLRLGRRAAGGAVAAGQPRRVLLRDPLVAVVDRPRRRPHAADRTAARLRRRVAALVAPWDLPPLRPLAPRRRTARSRTATRSRSSRPSRAALSG